MLEATTAETGSLLNFVRHSAQSLYGWMVWIIQCNLPLAFCKSREARRRHYERVWQEDIESHEDDLAAVQALMVKLQNFDQITPL
ncbi:hypothetical protein V7S43_005902 [Phytophthora oleae]|uniref:Uncharacterized protein n=1 Tax=Phytophthora oleae TaxID=2107226 RepID=A0ABD3FUC9_9STRA